MKQFLAVSIILMMMPYILVLCISKREIEKIVQEESQTLQDSLNFVRILTMHTLYSKSYQSCRRYYRLNNLRRPFRLPDEMAGLHSRRDFVGSFGIFVEYTTAFLAYEYPFSMPALCKKPLEESWNAVYRYGFQDPDDDDDDE